MLYIVLILCYAARSPLGRTSTIQRYPFAIPCSYFHSKANTK
ncbi:hypothetical protein [Klebsiella phage vB_KpnM-VAC25]|uniref:Uncharacterized protein n=1 Tax=Klebsiella phage vB_KpnM-VAC25 TaxID=2866703 RepID=A0A976M1A4_9CAUD|nr:hypothetical protein [Klebsiella phage vB_KpnM-VAC25]